MSQSVRIALVQFNARVGDLEGNGRRVLEGIERARAAGATIVAFPELCLSGYPPEDLLLKPDFIQTGMRLLDEIAKATTGLTAIVGAAAVEDDLFNAAAILHDGALAGVYGKRFLPNYGVFDENRYFQPGARNCVFKRPRICFGVSVCEDIWVPDGPPEGQAALGGAELLINLSASPYHMGKGRYRERMLAARAADNVAFIAYINLVGGQDELVFDGQSLIVDPEGNILARARAFEEDFLVADLPLGDVFRRRLFDPRRRNAVAEPDERVETILLTALPAADTPPIPAPPLAAPLGREEEALGALVLGTRDYVRKNGFDQVVLGLSGGIDSALVAAIAAEALGPENVVGVAMPTRYSSAHSLDDAQALAERLGIRFLKIEIDSTFQAFLDMLEPVFEGRPAGIAEENLQPRIRGTLLMALSNKFGWLVLTTGNKSEVGVGYSTLYGDTAGGFAVIKDVPKTLVYDLCRFLNACAGHPIIPQNILDKPPSAELRPDQKDTDSLPEYAILDPIIRAYVEESCSIPEIVARGFDEPTVRRVIKLVDRSEYKRRQSPPGVKITARAFGKDWRVPITNAYKL